MLKFKLKMKGYNIVVPDYVYNWELLDAYINQYNITDIRLVLESYKETFDYNGGQIHSINLLYCDHFGDKVILALVEYDGEYGYYVIHDGNFVVDIEFIIDAAEDMIKYINGDEDLDLYNPSVDYRDLFDQLEPEWQIHVTEYIMNNHLDEVQELLDDDDEITRNDIERNIDEILENIDELDELKSAFRMAEEDGSRSEVEGNIVKNISSFIEDNCDKLHLSMNKPLFSLIDGESVVPIQGNDVMAFVESIEDFELDS